MSFTTKLRKPPPLPPATCTAGGPDDTLVVTGSIYLLGEVMARLGRDTIFPMHPPRP